jgi:pantothenate synthetase
VVDGASLLSVDFAEKGSVVLLAASLDGVRLLDNVELV